MYVVEGDPISQMILTDQIMQNKKQETLRHVLVRGHRRSVQNVTICLEKMAWTLAGE